MRDSSLVFIAPPHDGPGLELRINFGMFAARSVTSAEIDELAQWLLTELEQVTIFAEQRHELTRDAEAVLHQVRIEIGKERLPANPAALAELTERLLERCDLWAREAIDARHVDV